MLESSYNTSVSLKSCSPIYFLNIRMNAHCLTGNRLNSTDTRVAHLYVVASASRPTELERPIQSAVLEDFELRPSTIQESDPRTRLPHPPPQSSNSAKDAACSIVLLAAQAFAVVCYALQAPPKISWSSHKWRFAFCICRWPSQAIMASATHAKTQKLCIP